MSPSFLLGTCERDEARRSEDENEEKICLRQLGLGCSGENDRDVHSAEDQ